MGCSFSAVSVRFVLHSERQRDKTNGNGEREERSPEEGTGRERKARFVSNGFGVGLAPNRRGPKPPEPRVSGVYPEEGAVGRREKSEKQY
jgi:hypothetical protein